MVGLDVGVFQGGVETGTEFDVFAGFDCAVMVEVGAEVAMAEDSGFGVKMAEFLQEGTEGVSLFGCSGVGGYGLCVQAAFVGYADAVCVVAAGVRACFFDGAHGVDCAVFPYVVVVAATDEAPGAVFAFEG